MNQVAERVVNIYNNNFKIGDQITSTDIIREYKKTYNSDLQTYDLASNKVYDLFQKLHNKVHLKGYINKKRKLTEPKIFYTKIANIIPKHINEYYQNIFKTKKEENERTQAIRHAIRVLETEKARLDSKIIELRAKLF